MNAAFKETMLARRSVRHYTDRPVPPEQVEEIVEAAASAPSAHNDQPWHFVAVTSVVTRNALVEAMAEKYDDDMTAQGLEPAQRKEKLDRSLNLLGKAPVIIVSFLAEHIEDQTERAMAVQGVAAATGYLLLAATASGLGACWYSAPLFCAAVVNECLGTNPDWEPQALVTLGYPDEQPSLKQKKPLKDIMTHA